MNPDLKSHPPSSQHTDKLTELIGALEPYFNRLEFNVNRVRLLLDLPWLQNRTTDLLYALGPYLKQLDFDTRQVQLLFEQLRDYEPPPPSDEAVPLERV